MSGLLVRDLAALREEERWGRREGGRGRKKCEAAACQCGRKKCLHQDYIVDRELNPAPQPIARKQF
jgi:hypothetical protein